MNWELYRKKITLHGETDKDRQIYSTKEAIESDFQNSLSYRDSYFNGATTVTGIQIIDESDLSKKRILMYPDINLNVGYNIKFDNQDWICIEADKTNPIYDSGSVQKCTHKLKVIKNDILTEIPCIVSHSNRVETTEGTKFFRLEEGQIEVIIPNNSNTDGIELNQVYQIGRKKYKVFHINDTEKVGLLILSMESTDDSIATPPTPTPSSDLIITGSDTITEDDTETYTSNMECTWEVVNQDGTTNEYITVTNQTNTSISLKANDVLGEYVTITATATSDTTITNTKTIQVVGLF